MSDANFELVFQETAAGISRVLLKKNNIEVFIGSFHNEPGAIVVIGRLRNETVIVRVKP